MNPDAARLRKRRRGQLVALLRVPVSPDTTTPGALLWLQAFTPLPGNASQALCTQASIQLCQGEISWKWAEMRFIVRFLYKYRLVACSSLMKLIFHLHISLKTKKRGCLK